MRGLLRAPGFFIPAVLTIGLGIGVNAVVFQRVSSTLLEALPYRAPQRLTHIMETHPELPRTQIAAPDFDDWKRRNAQADDIELSLKLDITYQVINAKTLKTLFDGVEPAQGWQAFFNRYAGAPGILRLSHVGFDDTLGHALVYVEHECGAECGAGRMLHLVLKPGGGWQVQSGVTVWMVK